MKIKSFLWILLFGVFCSNSMAELPKVIAHRGYWKTPSSAQNSLRALELADSIGVYGSEFDVWLTKDDVLIVNHDAVINGMGYRVIFVENVVEAKIEEWRDCSYA